MPLEALSAEDRMDFQRRLAKLDLDESVLTSESIEIDPGQTLRLEMAGEGSMRPLVLETEDISVMRRWIGTPERTVEKRITAPFEAVLRRTAIEGFDSPSLEIRSLTGRAKARLTKSAKANTRAKDIALSAVTGVNGNQLLTSVQRFNEAPAAAKPEARLNSTEVETIRAAARTFIHGDIATVEEFKPAVEAFFGNFQVGVWLSLNVVVKKNSTLVFGTGVHNLTASELIIEEGGRIVSHGHLNVNVTKIRRSSGGPSITLPSHVLTRPLPRPIFP